MYRMMEGEAFFQPKGSLHYNFCTNISAPYFTRVSFINRVSVTLANEFPLSQVIMSSLAPNSFIFTPMDYERLHPLNHADVSYLQWCPRLVI